MKKYWLMVSVALMTFMSTASLYAADAAAAVSEDAGFTPVIAKIGLIVIEILTPILVILATIAAKRVGRRVGIDVEAKELQIVEGYVMKGIKATERWAENKAGATTSEEKLVKCIDFVNQFMAGSGLKKKSSECSRLSPGLTAKSGTFSGTGSRDRSRGTGRFCPGSGGGL